MAISERKITDWTNPITSEEDRPKKSAADMKAAFDSNTNQLKTALNGAIDDLSAGDVDVTFAEAEERANIDSGETHATIFGKIKKWFSDLGPVAQAYKEDQGTLRFLRGDGIYAVPEVGEAGNGVPSGGTAGQLLAKKNAVDFDAEWRSIAPGDIGAAAPGLYVASLTLPAAGYTDLAIAITAAGVVTDAGKVYELIPLWSETLATREAEQEAWGLVNNYAVTAADTLTLTVDEVPAQEVAFALKEVV